jgi:ketosteroid isomerase-like protein
MKSRRVIFIFCLMSSLASGSAAAQEAEVRAAVSATLAALVARDVPAFANFYHNDTRGFFVDRTSMIEGFSSVAVRLAFATGLRVNVVMNDLDVKVYGNTAVSRAIFQGSVTLPLGAVASGTWRYSETRVLDEGTWKVVQYHVSQAAG